MRTPRLFLFIVLVLLVITGCNEESVATVPATSVSATPMPATPVPTVDANAIAELVLTRLQSEVVEPATAEPTVESVSLLQAEATLQESLVNVYQQANPSVVFIIVPPLGSGSGFVYSDSGHIVTNNHVVSGGGNYEIVFANGERRRAVLVGADVDSDLAVLKVDELPQGVGPLPLAEADDVAVGQFVVAIGNPFGAQGSMSLGIVSGLGRSLESQRDLGSLSTYSLPEVIQTDAPINPGNSGGPLLNLDGEVLGVNSAIASITGTNSGVGFSIPVRALQQIVPSLIENGRYAYPYIGAGFDSEVSLDEQTIYGLSQVEGAYVISVNPGSPAAAAGLVAADANSGRGGDLVIAIDGQPVGNFADLNGYLVFHTSVGQTIELTVLRNGAEVVVPLTLGERP